MTQGRTMLVRQSCGSHGERERKRKENRSICTAVAVQLCDSFASRGYLIDCRKAVAKKSQNTLATCKICNAATRMPYHGHQSIYLLILSRAISDHHLRCDGWLNFEFS